jgi:sialic acid synthase SpsE
MTIIIAECSGNHGGHLNKLKELIIAAKYSGCDMVKFQAYKPEDMPDDGGDYKKYAVPVHWYGELFETAKNIGIPLFASVFAPWAVKELERYNPPAFKIASPESTRLDDKTYRELATAIKMTGRSFIASSGRRDLERILPLAPTVLLYCVAGYPATVDDGDIGFIMSTLFQGFSDHTADLMAPLAMIMAGAEYIEKHFKVDEDCCDAAFSLTPRQMQTLCRLAHRCDQF